MVGRRRSSRNAARASRLPPPRPAGRAPALVGAAPLARRHGAAPAPRHARPPRGLPALPAAGAGRTALAAQLGCARGALPRGRLRQRLARGGRPGAAIRRAKHEVRRRSRCRGRARLRRENARLAAGGGIGAAAGALAGNSGGRSQGDGFRPRAGFRRRGLSRAVLQARGAAVRRQRHLGPRGRGRGAPRRRRRAALHRAAAKSGSAGGAGRPDSNAAQRQAWSAVRSARHRREQRRHRFAREPLPGQSPARRPRRRAAARTQRGRLRESHLGRELLDLRSRGRAGEGHGGREQSRAPQRDLRR